MNNLSDLLECRTRYKLEQINELNREIKRIELDTIKEYFQVGEKVIYQNDRSGYIKGTVVEVDGFHVIVDVFNVNGYTDEWVKGIKSFRATEIELI